MVAQGTGRDETMSVEDYDFDVLIVGAGISGIGVARYLTIRLPGTSYAILEGRDAIGGTWDLFRYPGIRSDSDCHTMGYAFKPWTHKKAISEAPAILDYLREAIAETHIGPHIRLNHRVTAARFDTDAARWTVTVDHDGQPAELTCRFLVSGTGYFDYASPHVPEFAGLEDFAGTVVHPQFWPEHLDYAGRRVVVIGSGATAVTIVPSIAGTAAHVTMLQRSPTYYFTLPAEDVIANALNRALGPRRAAKIIRRKNVFMQRGIYKLARSRPGLVRKLLTADVKRRLPDGYDVDTHFTPRYDPWDQRLCLTPDGDLFEALSGDDASVVTDEIDRFVSEGVRLRSGRTLEADIIVTATGLSILPLGGIALQVDGSEVSLPDTLIYKSMMLSDVPNFAFVIGYTNASWTLKVDLVCEHLCRLLAHMDARGADLAVPVCSQPEQARLPMFDLASGYVQRGIHHFPRAGTRGAWTMEMAYERDVERLVAGPVEDPDLCFQTRTRTQRLTA
jgi:cation diffusion facilitator CzcD-associated flavoprotein CzcO